MNYSFEKSFYPDFLFTYDSKIISLRDISLTIMTK